MKRFAPIFILALVVISGCGGGGGGTAITPIPRQTPTDMTLPQWDQTNPVTPTTDVIAQWQDGDLLTYGLAWNSSSSQTAVFDATSLVSTTHLDETEDDVTGKTPSGNVLKYGNRSFHIAWDISGGGISYSRTSYYEQDKNGNIYYLGCKDASGDTRFSASVGAPIAYPSNMSTVIQKQYIIPYAGGQSDYMGVTVGGGGKVAGSWDAYKITTTKDNIDGNFVSDAWFSPEIGYPVQFRFTFRSGGKLYDATATLLPPGKV